MQYGDEGNITTRRAALSTRALSIQNEVEIGGVVYTFSRKTFHDHKISMVVPEQLEKMNEDIAKLKYPSEHRPELILTAPNQGMDLSFSDLPYEEIQPEMVAEKTEELRMASKRMSPAAVYTNTEVVKALNTTVAYYCCQVATFDGDIYCTTFTVSVEGRLLLGNYICKYDEHHAWSVLIKQMLESLCDLSIEDQNGNEGTGWQG